jgi:hypothetical protein
MLLRHRSPDLDTRPTTLRPGLEHLDQNAVAVLRWLNVHKIDYVVVGPVARAIRGEATARGPVAIVPAPYRRNWERLAIALSSRHAGLRTDRAGLGPTAGADPVPVKLDGDKLAAGRHWFVRFEGHDLDIEGLGSHAAGVGSPAPQSSSSPGYQELLYESGRFELADELSVEVAAPEDLEHFSHVRRTGSAPEFRITRNPGRAADGQAAPAAGDLPADS